MPVKGDEGIADTFQRARKAPGKLCGHAPHPDQVIDILDCPSQADDAPMLVANSLGDGAHPALTLIPVVQAKNLLKRLALFGATPAGGHKNLAQIGGNQLARSSGASVALSGKPWMTSASAIQSIRPADRS